MKDPQFDLRTETNLRSLLSGQRICPAMVELIVRIGKFSGRIAEFAKLGMRGLAGGQNTYGDFQTVGDMYADCLVMETFANWSEIGEITTEEQRNVLVLRERSSTYALAVDGFDGSKGFKSNVTVGALFGIHKGGLPTGRQPRETMVGAAAVTFGPFINLNYAVAGAGATQCVLAPDGEAVVEHLHLELDECGAVYSPGGLRNTWSAAHSRIINQLEDAEYLLRYTGCSAADVGHILTSGGGFFSYPGSPSHPEGKLRLLYEAQPLAFLVEAAGGLATDGLQNILDIVPGTICQRTPLYVGSKHEVLLAREILSRAANVSQHYAA